jgi:hypothetical protein
MDLVRYATCIDGAKHKKLHGREFLGLSEKSHVLGYRCRAETQAVRHTQGQLVRRLIQAAKSRSLPCTTHSRGVLLIDGPVSPCHCRCVRLMRASVEGRKHTHCDWSHGVMWWGEEVLFSSEIELRCHRQRYAEHKITTSGPFY